MKYKGRHINKGVTIQQHHQQNSTKNFACQKKEKDCVQHLYFSFSLFLKSSSTKSTKSTME
jgi:hypothetical protein